MTFLTGLKLAGAAIRGGLYCVAPREAGRPAAGRQTGDGTTRDCPRCSSVCPGRVFPVRSRLASCGRVLSGKAFRPVEGGSSNDYDYVAGDPINNVDLDGQICWSCAGRRVGNLVRHPVKTVGSWALAKVSGAHCTDHKGMNVCYGVKGPLCSLMPKDGLTLGGTVLFKPRKGQVPATLLAHEVSHGPSGRFSGPLSYQRGEPGRSFRE